MRLAVVSATIAVMLSMGTGRVVADEPILRLQSAVVGASTQLTIELLRWSADTERAPLLAALSAPAPTPAAVPDPSAAGRAGRGGRGGRGAGPPPTPAARLMTAIKAAPTVGFIWGDGPTGYSVKYAWRSASADGHQRIVLATDRPLGAHSTAWPPAATADAEFTVIEIRTNSKGIGEGKASLNAKAVIDAAAQTLALEGYDAAPVLLKVTR
jgi:hypothetical protein